MAEPRPRFGEAFRFWLKLGFISFGGPSGQIAIMHAELVEKKKWVDEDRFLHALNYCMLLPGPEATQLATYCGWLLHGTWGGIVAGSLFVLPAALLLWVLSLVYVTCGHSVWLGGAFSGIKPAVIAIVIVALWRIGRRALNSKPAAAIAAGAFCALFFLHLPFPVVLGLAALTGLLTGGRARGQTSRLSPPSTPPEQTQDASLQTTSSPRRFVSILAVSLTLWWLPILLVGTWLGWSSTLAREGLFFSKAALVTFGGAYAVLPYVGQETVAHFGWISPGQMMDGLGLAETTPGPLIMVLQYIGFLGAWQQPGPLSPLLSATLGAGLTTWTTFVPTFMFIFLGAPYIEKLRTIRWLDPVMKGVTAAVVGVILNLAVWFGLHVLFPNNAAVDWFSLAVAIVSFGALQRLKANVVAVVLGCAALGLLRVALTSG